MTRSLQRILIPRDWNQDFCFLPLSYPSSHFSSLLTSYEYSIYFFILEMVFFREKFGDLRLSLYFCNPSEGLLSIQICQKNKLIE